MNGTLRVRLVGMLAATALCAGSATAWGQRTPEPVFVPGDAPYSPAAYPAHSMTEPSADSAETLAGANIFAAGQPPADWQQWKADVDARFRAIADKEAAAEKKAAGSPSVKAGGRIHADWAVFDQSPNNRATYGDWGDRTEFRRARISLSGEAFYVIDYQIEMDFADTPTIPDIGTVTTGDAQSTSFKNVYVGISQLPWLGHVRVGHFKEPFGLEFLTSTNYITFMERSLCDENAIVPGRNMGLMAFNCSQNERMTWAIGAFRSVMGSEPPIRSNQYEGGTAVTMRATFLPWYDEATEGRGLLHLGAAYSYRDLDEPTLRLRTRPEAHLAGTVLDTGSLPATNWQIAGGEFALVYGPLSVQSEIFGAWVVSPVYGDLEFHGGYVYVSYFLTGENRAYKRTDGIFTRVKPFENFFRVRDADGYVQMGKGAWEIAYRYSTLDFNDVIVGGEAHDHTLGLNWYLNPYTRVMFNYVNSNISPDQPNGSEGSVNIYETRVQIEF
jgi:phosphate-selective porin OprO/OprP